MATAPLPTAQSAPPHLGGRRRTLLVALLCAALGLAVLAPAVGAPDPAWAQQDPQAVADADAEGVAIPNLDDVRGNITLPSTGDGGSGLAWTSSDPGVVAADGIVTRPAPGEDAVEVSLQVTATFQGASATRSHVATVTPLPGDEDLAGYFFPHFVGESTPDGEAIYFAISNGNDPTSWSTLADGDPVLTSELGTQGLRDPFIIRSPEGDRFFLLATDLQIYGGGNFGDAQETGSRSLMVWESDDLVTWSEQREITLAPDDAGNLWAPEAYWDEANEEYMVYWASALYPDDVAPEDRDIDDSYQRMMYATTRDFVTFSEPQVWIDERQGPGLGMIDSTVAEEDGTYYRLTKDESYFGMRQESSTDLRLTQGVTAGDGWDLIAERIGFGEPNPWGGTFTGGEGPTIFRSNTDDTWYLLQDQPSYHGGQGYVLFETDDIASADWQSVPEADLPESPRHGTVIPVTATEYQRLVEAYQPDAAVESVDEVAVTVQAGSEPVLPDTVTTYGPGGEPSQTAVRWDDIDPAAYAEPGDFTVEGALDAPTTVRAVARVTVTADAVPVESLTLDPTAATVSVGATVAIDATVTPPNASARQITWSSADESVATVDDAGVVTGVAAGSTTITATTADGSISAEVAIEVVEASAPELPDDAWVDEFDTTTLDPRWTIFSEDAANWSLEDTPGSLTIQSLPGDTYQTDNTADNVFLVDVPAGDFTAITEVDATAVQNFQGAGLIAWQDIDNYVRAGLTHADIAQSPAPVVVETGREVAASYSSTFVDRTGSTHEYLRLQRIGDQVTTSYWDDGWVEADTVTVPWTTTQVGLYALAAGGAASHQAVFDWFALVEPTATDVVPAGTFSLRGDGDRAFLVDDGSGFSFVADRPDNRVTFVATPVDGEAGTSPVTLAAPDGTPVVEVDGRLAWGGSGDEPVVLRLTDAGGGDVVVRTLGDEWIGVDDDGALVFGGRDDAVALAIVQVAVEEHTITVDPSGSPTDISDTLYGIFYEDINYGADGGLYAELVRNRSFEFSTADNASFTGLTAWQLVERGSSGSIAVDRDDAVWLNPSNRSSLTVQSDGPGIGVRNTSYNEGVALEEDATYDFSVWARSATAQTLDVTLENAAGDVVHAAATVDVDGSDEWKQYEATLTSEATTNAGRLVVTGGAAGTLRLDMVSLFPTDTWVGPVNGPSVLRKDLAELVAELEPEFLRFPGGCVTNVGTFDTYLDSDGQDRRRTYQWKETIGAVEERPTNWNFWGYNQSYGIGYLEYMEWAEDLDAIPLPVVSVGANGCGSSIPEMGPDDPRRDRWIQDTLDLIEFATGDTDTEWGARRAELGHPEPFDMPYIGLGNEENTDTFQANFPAFRDAIEAEFPDITIISNSGPDDAGARFDELWDFNRDQDVELVDEHYYNSPNWFLDNHFRYDAYDRGGPHVFLGEYASQGNTLFNALAEASYMVGLERNADLVELASYAPMFANEDHVQWTPANMMYFDNDQSWGTVNYYNQRLFMTNVGDEVVPSTIESPSVADDISGGVFLSTWNTQAAYDDVTVTDNDTGEVLFSDDFADASQWAPQAGTWGVADGEYVQSSGTTTDARSIITDAYERGWDNYTLELDARKLSGSEGFLVGFGAGASNDFYWWNLGGWNNTRSVLQRANGGSANEVVAREGESIVTGQDYHVEVVVDGRSVELYLDGELQMSWSEPTPQVLYQVVTRDTETGDLLVKVVNPYEATARTTVDVGDEVTVGEQVAVTELAGEPGAVNTKADPMNVVPVERSWDGGANEFTYDFPPYSVTFLRLSTAGDADPLSLDVTLDPADPDGRDGWYVSPVTVTATTNDDATIEFSVDGGEWVADDDGVIVVDADGSHTLDVRAVRGDETSQVESLAMDIDTTNPELEVDGITDGQVFAQGGGDEVTWSATDATSGMRIVRVRLDGVIIDRDLPAGGPFVPGSLEPGSYELFVRAHDVAGNAVTQRLDFTVTPPPDTTKPTITVTGVRNGGTYGDSRVLDIVATATDSESDLDVLRVWLDDDRIHNGDSPFELELGLWDLDLGEHTMKVVARDSAGNRRATTITFTVGTSITDVLINLDRFTEAGLITTREANEVATHVQRAERHLDRFKLAQARTELQKARDKARDIDDDDVQRLLARDLTELIRDLD